MVRSRSARLAVLFLTLAVPLAGAVGTPAHAGGGSALVSAVVTEGNVHVQSTKGLSRVTVVLCQGAPVVADSWNADQMSGDVEVDGVVQAVFVHSGDNTTAAAQALLALLAGSGAVKGNSTGALAFHDEDACDDPGNPTDTTTSSTTVTTGPSSSASSSTTTTTSKRGGDGDPTTTVTTQSPTTTTTTTTTAGGGETVIGGTTTTTAIPITVLGETIEKAFDPAGSVGPGSLLARTGAGSVMFLFTLAAGLIAAGIALLSAFRRRRANSASSPC